MQKIGIKKIDEVLVVPDSENTELNLGYAFLEFETKRDAQIAYNKLQNKDVFGKDSKIKASWAEPLADPVKEEMHNGVCNFLLFLLFSFKICRIWFLKVLMEVGIEVGYI